MSHPTWYSQPQRLRLLLSGLVIALIGPFVTAAQAQIILRNDNNFDVWVALGTYSEGVMSLTGGQHGPDTYISKGWYKVGARSSWSFKHFTHLRAIAYTTSNQEVLLRPSGNHRPSNFHCVRGRTFSASQTVRSRNQIKQPLASFYPVRALSHAGNQGRSRVYRLPTRNIPTGKKVLSLVSVRNDTKHTVKYYLRWTSKQKWSLNTLNAGAGLTHSHWIQNARPEILFDGSAETGFQKKQIPLRSRSIRYTANDTRPVNPRDAQRYRFIDSNYQLLLLDDRQ